MIEIEQSKPENWKLRKRKKTVIHLMTSGKGGVGKSVVIALIAHWASELGHVWRGLDLDSENKVFHACL